LAENQVGRESSQQLAFSRKNKYAVDSRRCSVKIG
jgi:hypothetical protein